MVSGGHPGGVLRRPAPIPPGRSAVAARQADSAAARQDAAAAWHPARNARGRRCAMATRTSPAADRVADHTADHVNRAIRSCTDESIDYYREHPHEIAERLVELDREWDVERCLET